MRTRRGFLASLAALAAAPFAPTPDPHAFTNWLSARVRHPASLEEVNQLMKEVWEPAIVKWVNAESSIFDFFKRDV